MFLGHVLLILLPCCCLHAAVQESATERRPILMRCVDPDCSEPISLGKTMVNYVRSGDDFLSFQLDSDVSVLGKPADSVTPLAYVKIEERRGLVPLNLIREDKIVGKLGPAVPWPLVDRHVPVAEEQVEQPAQLPDTRPQQDQQESTSNNTPPSFREENSFSEPEPVQPVFHDPQPIDLPVESQLPQVSDDSVRQDVWESNQTKDSHQQDRAQVEDHNPHTDQVPESHFPPVPNQAHDSVQQTFDEPTQSPALHETVGEIGNTNPPTGVNQSNEPHHVNSDEGRFEEVNQSPAAPDTEQTRPDTIIEANDQNFTVDQSVEFQLPHVEPVQSNFDGSTPSPASYTQETFRVENLESPAVGQASDSLLPPATVEPVQPAFEVQSQSVVSPDTNPIEEGHANISTEPSIEDHHSPIPDAVQPELPEPHHNSAFLDPNGIRGDPHHLHVDQAPDPFLTEAPSDPVQPQHDDPNQTLPVLDTGGVAIDHVDPTMDRPSLEPEPRVPPVEHESPVSSYETVSLYLSCFDFLPAPLHEYMDRNNVAPHGVVLTLLVGGLWIVMMSVQLVISRNSRQNELEGKIENNSSIISKLKIERSAAYQKFASQREEVSRLEASLKEASQRLASVEDACHRAETQNRQLAAHAKESEEKLQKQQQAIHVQQQEKERLAKENHDLKSQASAATAEAAALQERCREKDIQLESLQQDNDSLISSQQALNARQASLQDQVRDLETQLERVTTSEAEKGSRIEELESETDLLKTQLDEKDNMISVLKDMFKELDVVRDRSDETDWEGVEPESKMGDLLELAQARADHELLLRQKSELEHSLAEALSEKDELNKQLHDQKDFVSSSTQQVRQATLAKEDAEKRLEVLEKYFNSREVELQRELGALQVRRQEKEQDASSLEKRLLDLEAEKDSYQSQLESMRRELSESERSFKSQLASMEKRAHENWVAARNAEREANDLRRDAVFLRQQLTMLAGTSSGPTMADSRGDKAVNGSMMDFSSMPLPPPPPPPPMGMHGPPVMLPEYMYQNHGYAPMAPDALEHMSGSRPESVMRDTASVPIDCDGAVTAVGGGGSSASSLYEFAFIPPPPPPPPSGTFADQFLMSSASYPHQGYHADLSWDQVPPTSQAGAVVGRQPPPSHSSGPPV